MLPENITIRSLESIGCFEDIPETWYIEGNAILKQIM
jgi:XTP/dITP diphosphohydrolase